MLLRAQNIALRVADREKAVLHPLDLEIEEKEFIILLGHNGSGKSTLIKILSGERTPSAGSVFLNNRAISDVSPREKAVDFITISQSADARLFTELTLEENIKIWGSRFSKADNYKEAAYRLLKDRNLLHQNQKVGLFSGGEKQQILICLALAHPPKILFLDEHTSALDPSASEEVMQFTSSFISSLGITTVMVTHNVTHAANYGTRVISMADGKIVEDARKQLRG